MGLSLTDLKEVILRLRGLHVTKYGRVYRSIEGLSLNGNNEARSTSSPAVEKNSILRGNNRNLRFSLMTYNVLSQDLLTTNLDLYTKSSDAALNWTKRSKTLLNEILLHNADIICLQEVHCEHYRDTFSPCLHENGYSSIYKRRTGDKKDGCAIFYKNNRFTLADHQVIEFQRRDLSSALDRDNIALIASFKPIEDHQRLSSVSTQNGNRQKDFRLVVATTHILYNPRRGDVKLAQLRLLLASLDKFASKGDNKHHPILLCGDFNSGPLSPIFRFIRDGQINLSGLTNAQISGQSESDKPSKFRRPIQPYQLEFNGLTSDGRFAADTGNEPGPDGKANTNSKAKSQTFSSTSMKIYHPFKFKSAYPYRDLDDNDFISMSHSLGACLVDYIFYSAEGERIKLISYKKLLTDEQMAEINPMPNEYLGSDHLSLIADFLVKR